MTSASSSNTLKTHTSPSKVCLPFIGHAILEIDVRHLSLPHGLTMQSSFHEKCTASALSQA
jgi:23S rRNA maturation mini-RNase III